MKKSQVQIIFACFALLATTVMAEVMIPRTSMARAQDSLDLEKLIPKSFGDWSAVPGVKVVEPPGSDTLSHEIYNQEVARGYIDKDGHLVMLLVAYGVSQSDRLQLHRPEICYAAQGFKVSRPTGAALSHLKGRPLLNVTRLVTQREERLEPVTYWMRIGNDVATGVVQRQFLKVNYGLRGLVPDGALIRISSLGLSEDAAFELQSRFIVDLLSNLPEDGQNFFLGDPSKALAG